MQSSLHLHSETVEIFEWRTTISLPWTQIQFLTVKLFCILKYSRSFYCFSVISCDFESVCLWASSNHSYQGGWLVVTPEQQENAQAGMMPATDHSLGSSDGKKTEKDVLQCSTAGPENNPFKKSSFPLILDALPFSSDGLLEWYYKAAIKQTKLKCCPFFCHRTFPSFKPFLCWKGCWDMQIPLNQPSFARKWQTLRFSAGSVWSCSSSGEPHPPGESSSFRFNCAFSIPQPHQPRWPQVSTHRTSTDALIIPIYIFV